MQSYVPNCLSERRPCFILHLSRLRIGGLGHGGLKQRGLAELEILTLI